MTTTKSEFFLGQEITVDSVLKRIKEYKADGLGVLRVRFKVWETIPLKESKIGIIVGIRTLSNGVTEYEPDCGHLYYPSEHFKALLVVSGLHTAPFLVKMPGIIEKQDLPF